MPALAMQPGSKSARAENRRAKNYTNEHFSRLSKKNTSATKPSELQADCCFSSSRVSDSICLLISSLQPAVSTTASTRTRSPPAISVFEWATIAQHLLETQSQPASPGEELDDMPNRRHRHRRHRRSNARALFNLMLTCRNLYNELPWAMPKWHLANLGLLVGCSEHWTTTIITTTTSPPSMTVPHVLRSRPQDLVRHHHIRTTRSPQQRLADLTIDLNQAATSTTAVTTKSNRQR
ncbi:hypothetical protein PTSG_10040 [Salpingoeca rosetta]|uniref:Uncharacterized protein n=1 Tax=Salpingoeca rosetta (strain ATCC 50818 / BSB-021) TaxID=946362 RepID=F2UPC0_SALR5|nr:uncharacterized protein PTSG_10040 [Salpingoeca rosetta]EGD79475.1 hypothetical protein PTSG_10040 [Salpingoeca rosetta]|eukprot:XP_004988956.1 hypothetical protein PTSG_10040 [Salpingoeca rosetta]